MTWDADHFWTLSVRGYLYDKNHAFFPLLPFLISSVRSGFAFIMPSGSEQTVESCTLISCLVLGNLAFVLSAVFLYKLASVRFTSGVD